MASRRIDTGIIQRGKSYTFTVAMGMDTNGSKLERQRLLLHQKNCLKSNIVHGKNSETLPIPTCYYAAYGKSSAG